VTFTVVAHYSLRALLKAAVVVTFIPQIDNKYVTTLTSRDVIGHVIFDSP